MIGLVALAVFLGTPAAGTSVESTLPETDGAFSLPAQEWPYRPGPRSVRVYVHYPAGQRAAISPATGLMLSLHNWGGQQFSGAPDPVTLAREFQVVAIGVDYLQSGKADSIEAPEPYDFGWLQALDALRALHHVWSELRRAEIPFDDTRIFATGGSGGGNVTLMANKLAPRTFAAIVPLCGMAKLSDDIAYNLPGGSSLNARYQTDVRHRNHLTTDEQELRFIGHPSHAAHLAKLGCKTQILVVHGVDDATCPFADATEMVENFQAAGLNAELRAVRPADLDGKVFTSTGHPLGNRTEIVKRVAGPLLAAEGDKSIRRSGPTDFERREEVRLPTTNGAFVIDYRDGPPIGRFDPATPHAYSDHTVLDHYLRPTGEVAPIVTVQDWEQRKRHVLGSLQQVMGELPPAARRVPLDIQFLSDSIQSGIRFRKLTYQSEPQQRVPAWLLVPDRPDAKPASFPAVLCLHQTVASGKDEVAGIQGDPELKYGLELARRGFVVLAPDYPTLGEHHWDPAAHPEYAGGTMKAIWDNIRAVDLLQALPEVAPERIGVIGHSLGGHNGLFTAAFDPRLKVIVSSCGFTRFVDDDVPSWNGPRYMPRIATRYGNDPRQLPFDFPELIASLAPRPFFCSACTRDSDFAVSGVRATIATASKIYSLYDASNRLVAVYPEAEHRFPSESREAAYSFLQDHLAAP